MNKIVTLLIFLINISYITGQNDKKKDSLSITSYVDKIIIKVNIDTQSDSYSIKTDADDSGFRLSANNQFRMVLSLDYEFIGASIGFSPKFLPGNNDDILKGKSSFTDYSFRFFLGSWTQELQYKKVQGFYLENTEELLLDWIEGQDPYLQFPDFKTILWGGSTSYVLNPNFSLRNVVYNTEWQHKSAGSFIPTLHYGLSRFSSTIIDSKSYENSYDIRLASDYYYTWVINKNWFISSFLSPSFGIRFSKEGGEDPEDKEKNIYWPVALDGGLQVGYSSREIIFGANFNFETSWYNADNQTTVTNNKILAKVYFGFRFDAPRVVKKPFSWINKKLGL